MAARYDRRDSYGRVISRPEMSRSLLGRRRRERRAAIAIGVLAALAVVAALAVWGSGVLGRDELPGAVTETARAVGATPAVEVAASAEPTQAPDSAVGTEIEIGWVGDTTPGSRSGNPPDNGRALFEKVRAQLQAPDLMVANLEGTYGSGGKSKCDGKDPKDCYAFQAPPAYAEALAWSGIDVVNLANNHSNDYLAEGMRSTRDALEANGVDYTGLNGVVAVREVDGINVAFLGFSPYPWGPSIADIAGAKELVRQADEQADVVVVLMHAGAEGADKTHVPIGGETAFGEFRGDSRAFSHGVVDAGADVVLGSGPHVIRGMEQYKGRLIAYSLGNFAGWRNFNHTGDLGLSGLLTVKVAGDGRVVGGKWLALKLAEPGVPTVDPEEKSLALVRKLSEEDFESPIVPAADGTFTLEAE